MARTQAVELRVEGVERLPRIGTREARPGYEFVVVTTSWKNLIPLTPVDKKAAASSNAVGGFGGFSTQKRPASDPADITMEPTPYVVPALKNHLWLLTDDRFADPVDLEAQVQVADHLSPDGFGIAKLDDVLRGTLVFEAPARAGYQALQFFDKTHGHALIRLTGARPASVPALGSPRQNELMHLVLTEAHQLPSEDADSPGRRKWVVGLRGTGRLANDLVNLPMRYVFAQSDRGCMASPEAPPAGLARPFDDEATFVPTGGNEGQYLFSLPAETRAVRLLIRAQNAAPIDLAGGTPQPAWPAPLHTIDDGSTARVHVLPTSGPPASLPAPREGRAYQLIDVVFENLKPKAGIEFQYVQLRLQASDGSFIDPLPLSASLPCHLPDGGVIPPSAARRFVLVYDVAPDERPKRLQYRGFELEEATVDVP